MPDIAHVHQQPGDFAKTDPAQEQQHQANHNINEGKAARNFREDVKQDNRETGQHRADHEIDHGALADIVVDLLKKPDRLESLRAAMRAAGIPDAAERIASLIEDRIKTKA